MKLILFEGQTRRTLPIAKLEASLEDDSGTLWLDITGPDDDAARLLREVFGFHPLAIEDTRNQQQRPKAEEFADHLFIILNPIHPEQEDEPFRELDVFVGRNYIVTVHPADEQSIDVVLRRLEPDRLTLEISATYLLYTLMDTVVDGYFPVLERVGDEIDELGNRIFAHPDRRALNRLFQLQQFLGTIARVVGPQQDIVTILMHHPMVFLDQNSQYHLRDISDHLIRAGDSVRTLRETVTSLFNLYMSAISNKLNQDVNRLTVLAVIIGAMTVVSGFYGMNFEHTWPPFSEAWSIPLVIGMMAAGMALVLYMVRRPRV